jgi:TRAP-type uncharacterized transport system fused permease subunit
MEDGVRNALTVAIATAVVGLIIGSTTLTGLGPKLAGGIVQLAQGQLWLTLVLTMFAAILLGTGLPTTPTYIITAAMCAPAMLSLGVSPLAAHMFVFYYGILSDLTPPTAIAPYAASAIAGTDHTRTEWTAMKLAMAGFLVPFAFVYNPAMLILDQPIDEVIQSGVTGLLGVIALGAALEGFLLRRTAIPGRVALLAAALLLIIPGPAFQPVGLELNLRAFDFVGIALLLLVFVRQRMTTRGTSASPVTGSAA